MHKTSTVAMPPWPGHSMRDRPTGRRLRCLRYGSGQSLFVVYMALYIIVVILVIESICWGADPLQKSGYTFRLQSSKHLAHAQSDAMVGQHPANPGDQLEVWARGPAHAFATTVALQDLLGANVTQELRSLCGRCLYRTLTSYLRAQDHGRFTVVLTGDIPAMWLRDSAVQMASYIPRIKRRPALRQTIEGAIRAQAYLILQVGTWTECAESFTSVAI